MPAIDIETLDSRAYRLYDMEASAADFARYFSKYELTALWEQRCIYGRDSSGKLNEPAPYDDEVYDALNYYALDQAE